VRKQLGVLAVLFLLAHLLSLPPTLEDIDSINFALAVRDFDVARHQPHPPGYPVFVALAKASTGVFRAFGATGSARLGLAVLSAVSGAALVILLFLLYRAMTGSAAIAWWAMAVALCSPLLWFTALRPLSDVTGLAIVAGAQALLLSSLRRATGDAGLAADPFPPAESSPRRPELLLGCGALLTGVAAGVRAQTVMLTAPLLIAALVWPRTAFTMRHRALALGAAAAGALVWGVPLLISSGGWSSYLGALGTQAGEDFVGVTMLWTTPTPRVAVNAALYSFVWPWGSYALGGAVAALAAIGLARAALRDRILLVLVLIAFAPYAAFHLLFHETFTVRYALPLVPAIALLAVYAGAALGRLGMAVTALAIAAASLVTVLPVSRNFALHGSPAFRAFDVMSRNRALTAADAPEPDTLAMHYVMRRVYEWVQHDGRVQVLPGPHGREWLALVEHWRKQPDSIVRFVADPRRTDLVLFDPQARMLERSDRWTLPEMPYLAGSRPGATDLYLMRPPGWMLERGWALTAEVGGVSAKDNAGPHIQPSVAWVRARAEPAAMILGGRNLGAPGAPAARLTLSSAAGPIGTWDARPGYFLWQVQLPAGTLLGDGYIPLRVSSAAADSSGRLVPVSLEQFDLQSDGTVMFAYGDGWYEPEYSPSTGRAWRWMSDRARLWVRPVDRDVTVVISGEDPRRYFASPVPVRVSAAGAELFRFTPAGDFVQEITIPARAVAASGGLIALETDAWFNPAERGRSTDPRRLALRIYSVEVR
jgi:hypothetical protein